MAPNLLFEIGFRFLRNLEALFMNGVVTSSFKSAKPNSFSLQFGESQLKCHLLSCVSSLTDPLGQDSANAKYELLVDLHELHQIFDRVLCMSFNPVKYSLVYHIASFLARILLRCVYTLILQVYGNNMDGVREWLCNLQLMNISLIFLMCTLFGSRGPLQHCDPIL